MNILRKEACAPPPEGSFSSTISYCGRYNSAVKSHAPISHNCAHYTSLGERGKSLSRETGVNTFAYVLQRLKTLIKLIDVVPRACLRYNTYVRRSFLFQGQVLKVTKDKYIEHSNFNPKRKTKFIIHGFIDTPLSNWVKVRLARTLTHTVVLKYLFDVEMYPSSYSCVCKL